MSYTAINPQFNFEGKYVAVNGSNMHYLDEGQGDPIVFIHGIPTWSYIWRNIIPGLSPHARCIAPDLIGMGRSDKPDIEYTVFDHIDYITQFCDALQLQNITLVMHAWGAAIGFAYAREHADNIKGLAFLEAPLRPATDWDMVSLPVQQMSTILDTADGGYDAIMHSNYFVNKVLPSGVIRPLSELELQYYHEPYQAAGSCLPLWQYLQDLPLGETESPVLTLIQQNSDWLQQTTLPKLMMLAVPGFNTTIDTVQWAKAALPNLQQIEVGEALHYAQESEPDAMVDTLSDWYLGVIQPTLNRR